MSHIQTKPPISKKEIYDLIESLAKVHTAKIDGVVLSNIVRTCHECGLKKSELIDLSIGDVSKGGKVKDSMKVGDSTISLTERAKMVLQEHIDYLGLKGYKRYSSSLLFPTKNHRRYPSRTLDNHLKIVLNANFTLEEIRQAGICNHYEELKNQELSAQECLEKTRAFARTSFSQVKGILSGNIQPSGKKMPKGQDIEYLKKNDEIMGSSRPDIGKLQELKKAVMEDTTLYDQLKNAFVEMIDRNISRARNAAPKADQDSDRPQVSELNLMKRIIEIFESYEDQSEDHRNAAEQIRAYFFDDDK